MELLNQILGLLHWNRIRGKPTLVEQHGFPNRTDSTIATNASGVFSITPASSVFKFYSSGKVFTKAAAETVDITNDQTLHYVYYTSAGVLTVSTTKFSFISTDVPVATVFKDGTDYVTCTEQHNSNRDRRWHDWAHDTIGARYESGLGGTFGNTTFSIAQGAIHDEDIEFDTGGAKTACRQWYRNSGLTSMRVLTNKTTPWVSNAGAPQYDNAGTMANVSANRYFCSYFFATNDAAYPIYMVSGQAQHVNLATARSESYPSILLTTTEWKLIYKVIYQESSGSAVWVETVDFRNVSSGPASTYTPTDHNSLTSRDAAGSHPATAIVNTPAGDVAATTVQAAIDELDTEKVAKALYDANTILAANSDNTPAALTVAEQRLVGRVTGGNIDDLTITQALDMAGTAEQGDVAYRGASAWALLPHGTGTQALLTGGHGANPSWATVREVLTAARTYYVRTDGNDSNTGLADTAGGAFLTIGKAMDVAKTLDLNGQVLTIQVRSGTYAESVTLPNVVGFWGAGACVLIGDTTTPGNVVISSTSANALICSGIYTAWQCKGLSVKTTTSGSGVYALNGLVYLYDFEFQDMATSGAHMFASTGGNIRVMSNYRVTGNATYHYYTTGTGSFVNTANRTCTIDFGGASKAFSYWCYCIVKGQVYAYSMTFTLVGGSAVTGVRRYIYTHGHVFVNGAAASYFPGDSDGTVDATTFALYA